jgi:coenzyme F420-reducing hydrogenase delta subunit
MACSSMVKDVFLLRAFESGSDAVVVMVCPEGKCRYVEGNIRAKKRIEWVKKILDEIEFDGRRLSLHPVDASEQQAAAGIIGQVLSELSELGPNPAG